MCGSTGHSRKRAGYLAGSTFFDRIEKRNWRLSLIGSGIHEHALRDLASQWGLDGRVQFIGHVEDIEKIWRNHHALVLPSRFEGLPLSLVEAMLYGRPAIATDVAGVCEILEDGTTGFIAKAPTVELSGLAPERAFANRAEWPAMGALAADRVRQLVPEDPVEAFASRLIKLASA